MIKVKITDYLYIRNEEQQQIFNEFFQRRSSYYKKTVHQVLQVSFVCRVECSAGWIYNSFF